MVCVPMLMNVSLKVRYVMLKLCVLIQTAHLSVSVTLDMRATANNVQVSVIQPYLLKVLLVTAAGTQI